MAAELLQAHPQAPASAAPPQHRYRLRFRKADNLRLVSHIDLLHVFERLMRRADLPFAVTQGFHPKPDMVFAQALGLGVAGLREVVDLHLRQPLSTDELLDRLNRHAPSGLVFLEATALSKKGSVLLRRAFYRLALIEPDPDLPRRCAELLARPRCIAERLKPRQRLVDIRPYFCEISASASELTMALWITPDGAARPEEVAKALGLGPQLDDGAVLERTHLELMDELPPEQRWLPEIPRLDRVVIDPNEAVLAAEPLRAATSDESLMESPMSFET